MSDIKKAFGKNLKAYRKAQGFSQEDFSEMIGITVSALSKIECGKNYPKYPTIEKIIEVLNIPPYLLYITNDDDFNIEEAYSETLELLKELKNDKVLFKRVYDFAKELCNKK